MGYSARKLANPAGKDGRMKLAFAEFELPLHELSEEPEGLRKGLQENEIYESYFDEVSMTMKVRVGNRLILQERTEEHEHD